MDISTTSTISFLFGTVWKSLFIFYDATSSDVDGLRYKLRTFDIEIKGPINAFLDSQSVYKNATVPTSNLSLMN